MSKKHKGKLFMVIPRNLDQSYFYDLNREKGFRITDPPMTPLDDENKKVRSMYGPQSPLYGMRTEDEEEAFVRYKCECGYLASSIFKGKTCPKCGTVVRYIKGDPEMTGWVSLTAKYFVIHPYFYQFMDLAMGKKKLAGKDHSVLDDIINIKQKVDIDGHISRPTEEEMDTPVSSEYHGIGMRAFKENFEEIIKDFRNSTKSKSKIARFDKLLYYKDMIFISHIPVYTTALRPQSISGTTAYYNNFDKELNPIISLVDRLDSCTEIDLDQSLYHIQSHLNNIWEYNYSQIQGKGGIIRGQLKGGSLNYTSRNEIIPDISLRENEVDLSYMTAMIIFKFHIIGYYMKLKNCNLAYATKAYEVALRKYSQDFYNIMTYLNQRDEWRILINRNPTLNIFSMLNMKVRKIIPDSNQLTISIPVNILKGLNADFDGDVINIIGLVIDSVKEIYKIFDPTYHMIISFDTGYINPLFSLNFTIKCDVYSLLTI